MLGEHVVGWFEVFLDIVPSIVARTVEGIAQVQQMVIAESVFQVGTSDSEGTFDVSQRPGTTCYLVARTLNILSVPSVFALGSIHSLRMIPGVRQRHAGTEVVCEEAILLVVGTDAPCFRTTFSLAHHLGLYLSRLHFLFHLII